MLLFRGLIGLLGVIIYFKVTLFLRPYWKAALALSVKLSKIVVTGLAMDFYRTVLLLNLRFHAICCERNNYNAKLLNTGNQCGITRRSVVLNCVHKNKIKIITVTLWILLFFGSGEKVPGGSNLRKQVLTSGKSLITGELGEGAECKFERVQGMFMTSLSPK